MHTHHDSSENRIWPVTSNEQLALVEDLAERIWNEHYVPLIGPGQVAYMLDRFQSATVMRKQIDEQNYHYFLIYSGDEAVGYIGVQVLGEVLFLSKLYVGSWARKRGLGRMGTDFVARFARQQGCDTIRLTVNKGNTIAISAYERMGFTRTDEVVMDIGGGYVMDDFVYEMPVPEASPTGVTEP